MSKETKEAPRGNILTYYQLVDSNVAGIYGRLAPRFGIGVHVLAEEGEGYTHRSGAYLGRTIEMDIVPKGKSYMRVSRGPDTNIDSFLDAVRAEQKAKQAPANPHRI